MFAKGDFDPDVREATVAMAEELRQLEGLVLALLALSPGADQDLER